MNDVGKMFVLRLIANWLWKETSGRVVQCELDPNSGEVCVWYRVFGNKVHLLVYKTFEKFINAVCDSESSIWALIDWCPSE